MLDLGSFEVLEPVFTPKPTAPDPQTIREALTAPDMNEWAAAMDDKSTICVVLASSRRSLV